MWLSTHCTPDPAGRTLAHNRCMEYTQQAVVYWVHVLSCRGIGEMRELKPLFEMEQI